MITVAIPTYGRNEVLINTIHKVLRLLDKTDELLVVDQTETHTLEVQKELDRLTDDGEIHFVRLLIPSITRAMNVALRHARYNRVLFLDDDIIPDERLIEAHRDAGVRYPNVIVAGRVLQPWHMGKADESDRPFLFNSIERRGVISFMAGNVCIPRVKAIEVGGFDTNFVRVAYHFEAEFSNRWLQNGGEILYEPSALIHHLKAASGGTRSYGNHLETLKPDHAVGRYYYNFCRYKVRKALVQSLRDLTRSVITKHHIRNPLWIPLTITAEIRGFVWAISLFKSGRGLIRMEKPELLIIASHPIQYTSPIFKELNRSEVFSTRVFYLTIPDKTSQSLGFNHAFEWDVPLFEGYSFTSSKNVGGGGLRMGFFGVRLNKPAADLRQVLKDRRPDTILLTGWHFFGLVQLFFIIKNLGIPLLLRMDSNDLKKRSLVATIFYRWYASFINIGLSVGKRNETFLEWIGIPQRRIVQCPHVVDNQYFESGFNRHIKSKNDIRRFLGIGENSFCYAYIGKFERKKNPMDIIYAFETCYKKDPERDVSLLMVGSGDVEGACKHYTKEKGLPVIFTGFVNQASICEMYVISDCIVLASNEDETWGLVVNEAMACGLPAIVSDRCGCASDLIRHNETGYIFEYKNIDQLAEYMDKMVEEREKTKMMGLQAKELIQSRYNISLVRKGIEKAMIMLHGE